MRVVIVCLFICACLLTTATSCSDSSPTTTIIIPEPPPPPRPKLVAYWYAYALDEDYYTWEELLPIDKTGRVYGYIDLKRWDEHYGLEVLLMTMDSFAAYRRGGAYSAWHKSIYREGRWYFDFSNVAPGNYVLVVDNTDKGWEETDFDFVNDYAVFDLEAYYLPSY